MLDRPIRPALATAAMLLLAACAQDRSPLGSDLHAAQAPCREQSFKEKSALVACLSEHERPVWAKDEPDTIDIYDRFAAQRAALARQLDSGAITQEQYSARLDQIESDARATGAAAQAGRGHSLIIASVRSCAAAKAKSPPRAPGCDPVHKRRRRCGLWMSASRGQEPAMDVTQTRMRYVAGARDPQAVLILVALLLALAVGFTASVVYGTGTLGDGDLTLPFG